MPRRSKPRVQHEAYEQQTLIAWFKLRYPAEVLAAIPNQLIRGFAQAGMAVKSGVVPGMPDLVLLCKRGDFGALFIEMKRPIKVGQPKGLIAVNQEAMIEHLRSRGYQAVVAFGFDSARKAIDEYMALEH